MTRLLLVEDEARLGATLEQGLERAQYSVDLARDGATALDFARVGAYDMIVLDLMLPKLDGTAILKKLRAGGSQVAVIVLTARDQLDDRVKGLDLGADDYLVKPFAFAELLARVRALVRRRYEMRDPTIRIGDVEIDTARREVKRSGESVALSVLEHALLEYLAMRVGEVVTRTDIWEHVYDFHSEAHSNVVDVYIGYLRKKLERDGAPKLIHTRRGQGYLFGVE